MPDQSEVLNGITVPDNYGPTATVGEDAHIRRIVLDVVNQAIYWQLKRAPGMWDTVETLMTPGSRTIIRAGIRGFRCRAKIPAAQLPPGILQAVVTVEAVK